MNTDTRRDPGADGASEPTRPVQAQAQALPLWFDDGADEAVPFVLTAAAHREVLGRAIPPLAAVPPRPNGEDGATVDGPVASDTRRAQARALLRSGMPLTTIAAALDVDATDVARWTEDLGDELARRRRRTQARRRRPPSPALPVQAITTAAGSASDRRRLVPGLARALAEIEPDGVSFVHHRVEDVAILMDAVREQCVLPETRVRVAVRLAPELPADRVRAMLADRLRVDASTVIVGRAGAVAQRPLELRVDVRDARAGRLVRGWQQGVPLEDLSLRADGVDEASAEDVTSVSGLRGWDSNPQTFRLTADCSAN